MKSTFIKAAIVPRIGHIQYLNCLPLYFGLKKNKFIFDLKLSNGKPTELAKALLSGDLDMAPIPSIEYGRNYKDLKLFSNISVSSDGDVKSIILISKFPIDELGKKSVFLTKDSATSQVLTKIILKLKQIEPTYKESPKPALVALKECDAALSIGDEALNLYYNSPKNYYLYDLGKEFKEITGQKMVYAVWAVRRDFFEKYPDQTLLLDQAFTKSITYSKSCLDEVAAYGKNQTHLPISVLKNYFELLKFDFDRQYQLGLLKYYELAYKFGFLEEMPELNFTNG